MRQAIAVMGTIFLDCKGFAGAGYLPEGRNVGKVAFQSGGVGRNVAENLSRVGKNSFLVSTVDASGAGQTVIHQMKEYGIPTDYILPVEKDGMGIWLAILGEDGNLQGSVSHLPDFTHLENHWEKIQDSLMDRVNYFAVEIDLTESLAERAIRVAKNKRKKLYGIPGNLSVAKKRLDLLKALDLFICNEIEAEQLFGLSVDLTKEEEAKKIFKDCAEEAGIANLVVTLGEHGALWWDGRQSGRVKAVPTKPVDTTGAGDAFFAGTVGALMSGHLLSDAVYGGTWIAARTIEAEESIRKDLHLCLENSKNVLKLFRKNEVEMR